MSTTDPPDTRTDSLHRDVVATLREFLEQYYRDELGTFAQQYPDTPALEVSWRDLHRYDPDLATDALDQPDLVSDHAAAAIGQVDLPLATDLSGAAVRVIDLPDEHTHYPGTFSPTEQSGNYRAIEGEVSRSTDVFSRIIEATFVCQRCGTPTEVPQHDRTSFQEPSTCDGCDRQGPFRIDFDDSSFVDAQVLRVATPPEIAETGGTELDVHLEADLAGEVTVGDRVTVTGTLHLEQQSAGNSPTGKFDPYLDAAHVDRADEDRSELDLDEGTRERIHALADGAEGDPLDVAAASLAPQIHGHRHAKRMVVLALVGGVRTVYPNGDADRGDFHVLLMGDPATAKSKLVERAEQVGWRTASVSGQGATKAGVTASAVQDDFGDATSWTLKAGSFVAAHRGAVCIDELDDMDRDVRSAMLEPMSKQSISIAKAGINRKLSTQTAVIAAANPKDGRFNEFEDTAAQFDLEHNLLSRFDLIFTFRDVPDAERDETIARHILQTRDAAKRVGRSDLDTDAETAAVVTPPVDGETLRAWIGLASQQPDPVFASADVREQLEQNFADLRGAHGYDDPSAPVPVTFRKLEGIIRIAEAAARFEFSSEITQRHVEIATEAVGESMRDFSKDDAGKLDADIQETGTSKSQKQRRERLKTVVTELQHESEEGAAEIDAVIEELSGEMDGEDVRYEIQQWRNKGWAYAPSDGLIKFIGRG